MKPYSKMFMLNIAITPIGTDLPWKPIVDWLDWSTYTSWSVIPSVHSNISLISHCHDNTNQLPPTNIETAFPLKPSSKWVVLKCVGCSCMFTFACRSRDKREWNWQVNWSLLMGSLSLITAKGELPSIV